MSEEIRHRFNRLTFYTLLFTFLGVSMTFIIFSSVGQATITCPTGQSVTQIGTSSDKCGQFFQSGAAQCLLIQSPQNQEVPGCANQQITFPTAFPAIPTKYGINFQCFSNTPQNLAGKTADQVCQGLGVQVGHLFSIIWAYNNFQSDNGETWTAMPAAKTELYGNANHELTMDGIGVTQGIFSVDCMTGSTGTSAVLRPEFAGPSDPGNPSGWRELAAVHTFLDVPVSSTSGFSCGSGSGTQLISSSEAAVNATIQTLPQPVAFRVVGIGGSGVGDNPVFNNVNIGLASVVPALVSVQIGSSQGNIQDVFTNKMFFFATAINPGLGFGNWEPIFSWWACTC